MISYFLNIKIEYYHCQSNHNCPFWHDISSLLSKELYPTINDSMKLSRLEDKHNYIIGEFNSKWHALGNKVASFLVLK